MNFQDRGEVMRYEKLKQQLDALTSDKGYSELPKGDLVRLSDGAALFDFEGEEVWLPFSQMRVDGDTIYATDWILTQKGLA